MKTLLELVEKLDELKNDKQMAVSVLQKEDASRNIEEFFDYFNCLNFVNINNEDDIEKLQTGVASVIFDETKFVEYLQKNDIDYFIADEYVEDGYDQEHESFDIFFANWNKIKDKDLMNFIENNVDIEWSDEWSTCDSCHKAFRISGDSYSWKPSYWIYNSEYVCFECLEQDAHLHNYITHHINNEDAIMFFDGVDLEKQGFKLFENPANSWTGRFSTGLREHSDDPKEILKGVDKTKYDFLFKHWASSQFDLDFELHIREK